MNRNGKPLSRREGAVKPGMQARRQSCQIAEQSMCGAVMCVCVCSHKAELQSSVWWSMLRHSSQSVLSSRMCRRMWRSDQERLLGLFLCVFAADTTKWQMQIEIQCAPHTETMIIITTCLIKNEVANRACYRRVIEYSQVRCCEVTSHDPHSAVRS